MKQGIIVSIVIVAAFALLMIFGVLNEGDPDPPTHRTAPEKLVEARLPDDLESPVPAGEPATPYGPIYDRALSHYNQHRDALSSTGGGAAADELASIVLEAMGAGGASPGFLDKHIPMRPAAEPAFGDAFERVAAVTLAKADEAWKAGRREEAVRLTLAVWTLGERAFRDNVRLYPRGRGLNLIASAGAQLYGWREGEGGDDVPVSEETLRAWGDAVSAVDEAWTPKMQVAMGAEPPIGDLVNLALRDKDRTMQVEATLRLGVHQHAPKGGANRKAILSAIEELRTSADPLVADAAAAAEAFTLEEFRRVR